MQFLIILLCSAFAITTFAKPLTTNQHNFVAYYETWSEQWVSDPTQSPLVKLPDYPNIIILAFMQPDASYTSGSYDLSNTGIQVPYDGNTLKAVVQAFHKTHPNSKLLIAVGGATYTNWQNLNTAAVANIVKDFNFDGVDIDFESSPNCTHSNAHVQCQTDAQLTQIISNIRTILPRPYLLTAAAWSIGAYGEDQWANAQPQGDYTGMFLNPLRKVGDQLDMLNVMSYDAGNKSTTGYDPIETYAAYKNYFAGTIAMGIEIPPETWGGNISSIQDVVNLAQTVTIEPTHAIMLWSLQKKINGQVSTQNPNVDLVTKKVCQVLQLQGC